MSLGFLWQHSWLVRSLHASYHGDVKVRANHTAEDPIVNPYIDILVQEFNFHTEENRKKKEIKPTPFQDWIATDNPVFQRIIS